MTRQEWLLRLRHCTSKDTLEKINRKNKYDLYDDELEQFNAAVDHRLAMLRWESCMTGFRLVSGN